jgi:transcriptional regulator with XRE-family HTH domain
VKTKGNPIKGLPITPALVTWARRRAGLSIDDAKNFGKIDEWERGESGPTYPQLEALASALKVPIAVFFFPEPPSVPDISQTFRTLPETELEQIPSRIKLLLRKAKAFQLNLMELTGGKNPASRIITSDLKFDRQTSLVDAADKVRTYLGISQAIQQSWQDDDMGASRTRHSLRPLIPGGTKSKPRADKQRDREAVSVGLRAV